MKIAKNLLKAVMWLMLGLAGLVLAAYLVLLGINWRDQPPSEAAIRLMNISANRPPVADRDNAYVYLMGFSVAPAQDPRAWGIERIASAQAQLGKPATVYLSMADLPGKEHDFKAQRPSELQALIETCKEAAAPCLKALENGEKTIAAWIASEPWLLERYMALLAHPAHQETLPFDMRTPTPPYLAVQEGQKLLLARAWQLAGQGDATGVQRLLAQDIGFWRQRLATSDTLLAKMVAAKALQRHFTWANLALRRLPTKAMAQGLPPAWATPFSDAERSMLRALAGEWASSLTLFRQIRESGSMDLYTSESASVSERLLGPFLKPMLQVQATSNRQAQRLMASEVMLQVPYAQYPAAVERARALWAEGAQNQLPERFYNPVGDLLLSIDGWAPDTYAARVSDLEGLRRIALLTTELRSQGVATEQLAQKLVEATARNPYTEEPFAWDESDKAVVFTGLAQGERGRHALVY